ncbi:hypothetical protein E4U91_36610 [Streptomyces lasalocidi]|uniref:Uncharacterized protein n=1 Tax=Streptomyces lasalocidi TaxID=324833 RepID=A0A4U5W4I7_STRLS|nr:hypothetical protein E4U91_36610 [Streptomyces lasalocidi]
MDRVGRTVFPDRAVAAEATCPGKNGRWGRICVLPGGQETSMEEPHWATTAKAGRSRALPTPPPGVPGPLSWVPLVCVPAEPLNEHFQRCLSRVRTAAAMTLMRLGL